jgi:outer membrane protein assembly factor BamB
MKALVGLLALALTIPTPVMAGDTWPGWRGPTGLGISDEKDLPLTWGGPANDNVLWKSPLPGTVVKAKGDHNQSSPIVWKDRVFVIAAYWPEGVAQTEFAEHHVACYSATDGKLLWDVKVPPGPWLLKDLRGGYAAPTPCTDGERVYALFGSSELAALDFDGRLLWRKDIAPFAWDVAIGTSPILTRDAVLVLADGTKPALSRLIAFDPATGNVKWERKRPDANFNHTTPLLIEVNGKPQLVIASSGAVQGVDPADGAIIWWATNKGDVPTPVYGDGLIYSEGGRGGPGIAVDPTGMGDVTATKVKWTTRAIPEGYSSPTIAGGHVYRAHSPGVLSCFALATGKRVFAERLPAGFNTSASPVLTADGRLYFVSGGKSIVLPVGPTFEPLATNDLGDGGAASPAVAHGRLYLKGSRYLYCIGKAKAAP